MYYAMIKQDNGFGRNVYIRKGRLSKTMDGPQKIVDKARAGYVEYTNGCGVKEVVYHR